MSANVYWLDAAGTTTTAQATRVEGLLNVSWNRKPARAVDAAAWTLAGDGTRQPIDVSVSVLVQAADLSSLAAAVHSVVESARSATLVGIMVGGTMQVSRSVGMLKQARTEMLTGTTAIVRLTFGGLVTLTRDSDLALEGSTGHIILEDGSTISVGAEF